MCGTGVPRRIELRKPVCKGRLRIFTGFHARCLWGVWLAGMAALPIRFHQTPARADIIDPSRLAAYVPLEGAAAEANLARDLNRASELLSLGDHAAAAAHLDAMVQTYPNDYRVWFFLAVVRMDGESLTDALTATQRSLELKPDFPVTHWVQGLILAQLWRLKEARAAFDRGVQSSPELADAYLMRGRFLVLYSLDDAGAARQGIQDLEKAMQLGCQRDAALGFLGYAYLRLGEKDQAESSFLEVLSLRPGQMDAVRELVQLYISRPDLAKARALLESARPHVDRALPPEDCGSFTFAEALLAVATGQNPDRIDQLFVQAADRRPADPRIPLRHAGWLESNHRFAEAIAVLRQALRRPPFDPDVAAHLAWLLADQNQSLEEALQWITVARQKYGEYDQYVADTEAWVLYRQGRFADAWQALGQAIPLAESVPEVAYHAGAIQARLGNRDLAIRFLEQSLRTTREFSGKKEAAELLTELQR
jgi:tetratricopeptide (TPR) repeat protein